MNYTTYLFDFDYTLADSSRGIVTCFRIVLERHQYTNVTDEAIKRTIGKTLEDSFSILTEITDPDQLATWRKEYSIEADTHMNVNTFLFPETISTLTKLKNQGARIGIISTKYRHRILDYLKDFLPADFFDIVIGGEDVKQHKPNPEGVWLAIERLGVRQEETLYIGDSTVDAETAQAAGVDFVGVTNGMTTAEELAAYPHREIIGSLDELLPPPRPAQKRKWNWKLLKTWIRSIHIQQIRGRKRPCPSTDECTCCNCALPFVGDFCPRCGQTRDTSRYTPRSAVKNVLGGMTNIDSGFGYTLLELLFRPGYMIHDYMAGKRVRYFRPFQTLFVLAAVYILLVQLIDPKALEEEKHTTARQEMTEAYQAVKIKAEKAQAQERQLELKNIARNLKADIAKLDSLDGKQNSLNEKPDSLNGKRDSLTSGQKPPQKKEENKYDAINLLGKASDRLDNVLFVGPVTQLLQRWAHGNKALSILLLLPVFALATKWAFRKRTFNRQYNLTEHLFVQAYIACQILLISIFYFPFNGKADVESAYDVPWWLVLLLTIWIYKQLFRGTWKQTFGRTLLMYLYSLLIIIGAAIVVVVLYVIVAVIYAGIAHWLGIL